MKTILKWLYYTVLFFICFEVALLILGYRRYTNLPYSINSQPSYCLLPHSSLGFKLKPGNFNVTINKGLSYQVTHSKDSLRLTSNNISDTNNQKIYFFGCSYTYGMGVNDDETFPYLIQKEIPNSLVKNYGVPGYGNVQTLLLLKTLIATNNKPDIAVVNYASFHDIRDALTPKYRLSLKMGYEQANDSLKHLMNTSRIPYVNLKNDNYELAYCKWKNIYNNWYLRETLASVNYMQTLLDKKKENNIKTKEITLSILKKINNLCINNNIRLIVTGITKDAETELALKSLDEMGITTKNIDIDLNNEQYNNAPFDNHPNKLAHEIYAKRILPLINIVEK